MKTVEYEPVYFGAEDGGDQYFEYFDEGISGHRTARCWGAIGWRWLPKQEQNTGADGLV